MRRLLVLRPEPGASATAAAATARGFTTIVAPLFAMRPIAPDDTTLSTRFDAVLLTSANAARAIAPALIPRLSRLPVYAVGDATARAARIAGFDMIAAIGQTDAAGIVGRAATDGIRHLLHPCGREHRGIAHPGIAIAPLVIYAMEAATDLPAAAAAALPGGAVALLHSPRAAALFADLLARAAIVAAGVRVAALSPAVAAATCGRWAACAVADHPTDVALLAAAARLCD